MKRKVKYTPPVVVPVEPQPTSGVDKDDKKLQIGSVVALQKAGRDKYTLKGKVIEFRDGGIRMRAYHNGGIYYAKPSEIKRVSFKPTKKPRWEEEF